MITSTAQLDTDRPERFIKQLVSHLSHRLQTSQPTPAAGILTMPDGSTCELSADASGINLLASAMTHEGLHTVQKVTEKHLLRFTESPALTLGWTPTP